VWITGDFFVRPRRLVVDLEAALRDTPLDGLEANVRGFFERHPAEMLMLTPEDFIAAIRAVTGRTRSSRLDVVSATPCAVFRSVRPATAASRRPRYERW
jgi:hypothetical protein